MHEFSLYLSSTFTKFLLCDPCHFFQIVNPKVQKILCKNFECTVDSGFDDSLPQTSISRQLSNIQPGLLPKALEILSFSVVSDFQEDITALDAYWGNVFVAMKKKDQVKVLAIEKEGMRVFLDISINFLDADSKRISLIVPEELGKPISGLSFND